MDRGSLPTTGVDFKLVLHRFDWVELHTMGECLPIRHNPIRRKNYRNANERVSLVLAKNGVYI